MAVKKGKFYGVGVGPGDAELITVKALRVLAACPVIAVPDGGASSPALNIVSAAMDISGKKLLNVSVPMTRDKAELAAAHERAVKLITAELEAGRDVAMPNLGDVTVYASCAYLLRLAAEAGYETELIPGVTSFCAAAAKLNMSLTTADKPLLIIPGSAEGMDELIKADATRVIMKSGRSVSETVDRIENLGLLSSAAAVENCGMAGERLIRDVCTLRDGASYFTTIIIKETD